MNKVILMGRLTRNPDVRYSQGEKATCVARYTLAVNRRFRREGDQDADFINCVAFGRQGEFAEKYLKQGTKIVISGRIQTGSYTNRDGVKVYTTDVVVEEQLLNGDDVRPQLADEFRHVPVDLEEPPGQGQPRGRGDGAVGDHMHLCPLSLHQAEADGGHAGVDPQNAHDTPPSSHS